MTCIITTKNAVATRWCWVQRRPRRHLPASQVEYIEKLATHGAKIALVVTSGSPLALGEVEDLTEWRGARTAP